MNLNMNMPQVFGHIALFFFVLANVYTPAKWMTKQFPENSAIKKSLADFLPVHIKFNILALIFTIFHMLTEYTGNLLLYLSMVMMLWLTMGGFMMRTQFQVPGALRQHARKVHAQLLIFWILIGLLIVGHGVIMWW